MMKNVVSKLLFLSCLFFPGLVGAAEISLVDAPNRLAIIASHEQGISGSYLAAGLQIAETRADDFPLQISTPRSSEGDIYAIGEEFSIRCVVPGDTPCHINLFSLGTRGNLIRLFPNQWAQESLVHGSSAIQIPPPKARFALRTSEPPGTDLILAIAVRGDDTTMQQATARAAGPFAVMDDLSSAAALISEWTRSQPGRQVSVRPLAIHTRGAELGDGAFCVARNGNWIARVWIDRSRMQAGRPLFLKLLSNQNARLTEAHFVASSTTSTSLLPESGSAVCKADELLILPRGNDSWAWLCRGPSGSGVLQLTLQNEAAASLTLELPLSIEGGAPLPTEVETPSSAKADASTAVKIPTPVENTAPPATAAATGTELTHTTVASPSAPAASVPESLFSPTVIASASSSSPDTTSTISSPVTIPAETYSEEKPPTPASRSVSIAAFLEATRKGKQREVEGMLRRFPWLVESRGERKATALHWAASEGHAELVSLLASSGAWVNAPAEGDMRPMHLAAWHGHLEVVRRLIAAGAALNPVNRFHETPLLLAVKERKREVVQELLKHRALPHIADSNGSNALAWAGINQDQAMTALLEQAGGRPPADLQNPEIHRLIAAGDIAAASQSLEKNQALAGLIDFRGRTPLHEAAARGASDLVSLLLKSGASINQQDTEGRTALHLAGLSAHPEVFKILLAGGANLTIVDKDERNPIHLLCLSSDAEAPLVEILKQLSKASQAFVQRDLDGCLPLHLAVQTRKTSLIPLLIAAHAPTHSDKTGEGLSLAGLAARHGDENILALFLSSEADVTATEFGRSFSLPLIAAESGNVVALRFLLQRQAPVTPARDGTTLLHAAVRSENLETVREVLKLNPAIDAFDVEGNTPLHLAAGLGQAEILHVLMTAGARPELVNGNGLNALHLAALNGSTDTLASVLKAGLSIHSLSSAGDEALHLSAEAGNSDIVEQLLLAGATVDKPDARGRTAAMRARAAGFDDIADFLERKKRP